MMGMDITGWKNTLHEVQFGLGYNPDAFAFEAAEFLADNKDIQGNILNTSMPQGDALIWKGAPKRPDLRRQPDPTSSRWSCSMQWEETRKALSDDDVETWKPLLDKYEISAIMIEAGPGQSPATYQRLMQSPNWVPFYDDGRIVMFGRADATGSGSRLLQGEPARSRSACVPNRTTGARSRASAQPDLDDRLHLPDSDLSRLQSRTQSARRWLNAGSPATPLHAIDSAADCPIRPAACSRSGKPRIALAKSPDDWVAYRMLERGLPLSHDPGGGHAGGNPHHAGKRESNPVPSFPSSNNQMSRFQQRVTALNFAIQTTPPPESPETRRELLSLNLELYRLYLNANALDLARDRLQVVLDTSQPDDFPAEVRAQFKQQLDELDQQIKLVEDSLVELETDRQAGPVEQANFALARGARRPRDLAARRRRSATTSAPRSSNRGSSISTVTPVSRTGPSTCSPSARSTTPTSAPSPVREHPGKDESISCWGTISPERTSGENGRFPRVRIDRSSRALERRQRSPPR